MLFVERMLLEDCWVSQTVIDVIVCHGNEKNNQGAGHLSCANHFPNFVRFQRKFYRQHYSRDRVADGHVLSDADYCANWSLIASFILLSAMQRPANESRLHLVIQIRRLACDNSNYRIAKLFRSWLRTLLFFPPTQRNLFGWITRIPV